MTVLYRTHRPSAWNEVIGQEHIVDVLKESVSNGKISHAYLFSGSRGTGKTTTARLLAKALKTASEDVYEIDAASNRGIDNIRELRDHVSVMPFSSKYKVYIIDEVHMLSKDAWNALLKTLEEPPQHVIFVLATTELNKVPDTIISRCQTFSFRRPTRETVRKFIISIAKKESYDLDAGAADLIALLGDGSFRDSLQILDKVISYSPDKKISRKEAEAVTGAPKSEIVNKYIDSVLHKNVESALQAVREADKMQVSMTTFSSIVLERMRYIFLVQNSPSMKSEIEEVASPDDVDFIVKLAGEKLVTPAIMSQFLMTADEATRISPAILAYELLAVKIGEMNQARLSN